MAINGPIQYGLDDYVRTLVEQMSGGYTGDNDRNLTIILTTRGGFVEVVKRLVETIRHHYNHVTFVVPNFAFSAGTVLAMSGDDIFMDYYSRLGPIDPQVPNDKGQLVPALGYLIQWQRLLDKAEKEELTLAELQVMVNGFNQAELYAYEQARELSVSLLKDWLAKYKFSNWTTTKDRGAMVTAEMREERAEQIARQLNDTDRWHSHGHGISMDTLREELNLQIDDYGERDDISHVVKTYHSIMQDYMDKMGWTGAIHGAHEFLSY